MSWWAPDGFCELDTPRGDVKKFHVNTLRLLRSPVSYGFYGVLAAAGSVERLRLRTTNTHKRKTFRQTMLENVRKMLPRDLENPGENKRFCLKNNWILMWKCILPSHTTFGNPSATRSRAEKHSRKKLAQGLAGLKNHKKFETIQECRFLITAGCTHSSCLSYHSLVGSNRSVKAQNRKQKCTLWKIVYWGSRQHLLRPTVVLTDGPWHTATCNRKP